MPRWLLLPVLALLSACAVGPDYERPASPPPALGAFQTAAPGATVAEPVERWWRLYDDPALDRLVERALAANTDLRAARANLLRAQAVVREARSGLLPTGDLTAGADYGDDQGNRGGSGTRPATTTRARSGRTTARQPSTGRSTCSVASAARSRRRGPMPPRSRRCATASR